MVSPIAPDQNQDVATTSVSDDTSNNFCVISAPPTLTVVEAVTFEQTVRSCCNDTPGLEKLVIDLSNTNFIDSSGLGSLVICYRTCEQHNTTLVLRGVQDQVLMVLSLTDLDKVFILEPAPAIDASGDDQKLENSVLSLTTHPSVVSKGKRAMDILGACVGLAITAVLAIPIAIAVKLEDGGPVFFKQIRCSWMGKKFYIWKFRSMVTNAEALKNQVKNEVEGPLFKNENDPRITRVGRFLRKTSLDELPQFWNVLQGDMSLVGTRPPTPDEIEQYQVPEWQRLDVKPGMTGEWQVNGRSTVKKFEDVIRMDLNYQENWSLMYDIKLILKTILVLFSKQAGAA
jgi:anti-anti-sigma factor